MFQCFVICPFGSKDRDAEERRLLDQLEGLKEYVFGPAEQACAQQGFPVKISISTEIKHGRKQIQDAVQKCIDQAAAVIVILSADKPNVYLEMGWAQGMWHDPICLVDLAYKDKIPADINNDLSLLFATRHIDGSDAEDTEQLVRDLTENIIDRIKSERSEKQFKQWPATTLARGRVHIYNRFSKAISFDDWSDMIEGAKDEIVVAGTSLANFTKGAFHTKDGDGTRVDLDLEDMLFKKALDGVKVKILLYHNTNPAVVGFAKNAKGLRSLRKEIDSSFKRWSTQRYNFEKLARSEQSPRGSFEVVQIKRFCMPLRVTLTESRALATLKLYTESFNSGLCIEAFRPKYHSDRDNMSVYQQIKRELEFLIAENKEDSEAAYRDLAVEMSETTPKPLRAQRKSRRA